MKIEFEVPDDLTLKYIYTPAMTGAARFYDTAPGTWLVYATSNACPTYYGAFGRGPTPQAAIDHALTQVNEYLARNPQGRYNVKAAPSVGLDLDFLKDL